MSNRARRFCSYKGKIHTGAVLDRTFRSGDKVEEVRLEKREMQYLYSEADCAFMDLYI